MPQHIDFDRLERQQDELTRQFRAGQPYEHVAIDGFLHQASYQAVLRAIPAPVAGQKSSDYIFAKNKYENPQFDQSAAVLLELRAELTSPRFSSFLTRLAGKPLFVDANFVGGGLHQGGPESFLDMHADFSRHPAERLWVREFNLLLYLNEPYDERWGGHLEMVHADTGQAGRVSPVGNRMVVMLTKGHTLHGYKPIAFPPGRYRTSIAAYAYSEDADFAATPERSTLWKPSDAGVVKQGLAKVMPGLVKIKRAIAGSSTAKRAQRDK